MVSSVDELVDEDDDAGEDGDDVDDCDCDWISCKDEIRECIDYSFIGKIFHDKAKVEADGSPNLLFTGRIVDIMRNVDEDDFHLYFKYFNHEVNDG
jgi:hypothetical protein